MDFPWRVAPYDPRGENLGPPPAAAGELDGVCFRFLHEVAVCNSVEVDDTAVSNVWHYRGQELPSGPWEVPDHAVYGREVIPALRRG